MIKKVVIIGGGLSGLHCGVLLLKKGCDVTILEQHITVGGLAAGFRRKGYYFDSGLARFAADSLSGYFLEAGLKEKVLFQNHSASLRIKDKTYQTRSIHDFISACAESFLGEAEAVNKFYNEKIKQAAAFMITQNKNGSFSYKGFSLVGRMLKTMAKTMFSGNAGGIGALMSSTDIGLKRVLGEYFEEQSPSAEFLYSITSDMFNKGGETSLMTFIGSVCSNMELGRYFAGGFQHLCNIYADEIKRLGGKILTSAKATKIRCENCKAAGVEYTSKGNALYEPGDIIISAADINKLFLNLLDGNAADSDYIASLKKQETTSPVPILYLGVKVGSEVLKERFMGAEELIYYPGNGRSDKEEDYYKSAPMILHSSCINNPEHAPLRCSNIQIYLASPPEGWMDGWGGAAGNYADVKKRVTEQIMEHVCSVIPELKDASLIDVCELGTPITFERFTGNKDGAHSGFTWDRALNTINPKMGSCDIRPAKIENLYAIGHWTGYLGGVTNAFTSARQAAKDIK